MTQDISKVTKASDPDKKKATQEKEFWIVEMLKKLLEFNMMKYGTKKKF